MTTPVAHAPLFDLVIVDCADPETLGRFYADLLGWSVRAENEEGWVDLVPPRGALGADNPGGQTTIAFQRIDDYVPPTWPGGAHPQQLHLDFSVGDIDAAEPRVLELGATRHPHQPTTDGGFRVYLDPAGHPFCLIR
ncbi:hypothetical protein SAMN04488544_4040 [Microlunatus sagamiharensis]|uniref:VOC domain-containing protein n=1 Tax=Microlunatus sagamiharensis TaxID=546874 RepID=A0A1H2NH64_9ACTN|nr:VOC family protein [Microlunatus sagamiharensis]SDV04782.1 hypothetical protein SAMN04488544_4040 [Microlunatus sagamiharensis]